MHKIILKPGREQSAKRQHPWIFSGAVEKVEGTPGNGQTVEVFDHDHQWIARGSYSKQSQITVRILTFNKEEPVDEAFWRKKLINALNYRKSLDAIRLNDSVRLVFAESDGMPGVIVDRYGDFLVCQFSSAGAEMWRDVIVKLLKENWPCQGIFERSDSDSRLKEGYPPRVITLEGSPPPSAIPIHEGPLTYLVDVYKGHKTGFYLDQSFNRKVLMNYCNDKYVLNAFSYTGGFGVAALYAGARNVINVDTSEEVLEVARRNYLENNLKSGSEFICEDVFKLFRSYRDSRKEFDVIVLDPPKFVASASQLAGGSRGYKDINLLAFKLLKPGGLLVTFSCSGYVKPDLFQKIVSDAALDAGRNARILEYLHQAPDHPVSLNYPEGLYLKGLICQTD